MREVILLAAGGTISSVEGASGHPGATPQLDARALAAEIEGVAEARSLLAVNGSQLTLDDALTIARAAVGVADAGGGVVVTSGTDTIEELAVLCDAMTDPGPGQPPIVFTGAIRPASSPGADGPANIRDAVAVAAAGHAAGLGAVVCFAGEIHAARAVRKTDSTSPRAFGSPRGGAIGRVVEGRVEIYARPVPGPRLAPERLNLDVPIVGTWLGDDGALLRAAAAGEPDGLVLVALGAGHLPPPALAALRELGDGFPIALAVRPDRGTILQETYGFEGSERDVLATGVIPAAGLAPAGARMLLLAALGAGLRGDALRAVFSVGT